MDRYKDLRADETDDERRLDTGREILAVVGSRVPSRLGIEHQIADGKKDDQPGHHEKPDIRQDTERQRRTSGQRSVRLLDGNICFLAIIACFFAKSTCRCSLCGGLYCPASLQRLIIRNKIPLLLPILGNRDLSGLPGNISHLDKLGLTGLREKFLNIQDTDRRGKIIWDHQTDRHRDPKKDQNSLGAILENETEEKHDQNRNASVKAHFQDLGKYRVHSRRLSPSYASRSYRSVSAHRRGLSSSRHREMH